METRSPALRREDIDLIPVESIRLIYGTGETPFLAAAAHVEDLKAAGKHPITCLRPGAHVREPQEWAIDKDEWEDAVRTFVANVPSDVVECGNEPNPPAWPDYWPRLRSAARIIRQAGKKVILGGSPPAEALTFLGRAQTHRAFDWVDGIGLHPYMPEPSTQIKYVRRVRDQLDDWGARHPLHLTEFGWGTTGTFKGPGMSMVVTEQAQADYLTKAFRNFRAPNLRIEDACWFSFQDRLGGSNWDFHAGVRRIDGSWKPSYEALKALAPSASGVGVADESPPHL